MPSKEPKLSVVVVESGPGRLRPAFFDALAPRLADGTIEIVVVAASAMDDALAGRPGTRVVRCGPDSTVPRRRGAGLAAARAPIVALTESFCVPASGWADAILRAHGESQAIAVGGPVDRRNGSAALWALSLCEYGRFFRREPAGPVGDLPGINVAYDVARLRQVLGEMPEEIVEVDLHRTLRARGETLWREPAAIMLDESARGFAAAVASQYHHGRLFGGQRAAGCPLTRRLLYLARAPAVPLVLAARIARETSQRRRALIIALPHLLVLLLAWAVGEAMGSLFGVGESGGRWV